DKPSVKPKIDPTHRDRNQRTARPLQDQRALYRFADGIFEKVATFTVFHLENPKVRIELNFPRQTRFDLAVHCGRPAAGNSAEHAIRRARILKDGLGRRPVENSRPVESIDLDEDGAGFLSSTPAHSRTHPLDITSAKVSRDPDAGFQSHQLQ